MSRRGASAASAKHRQRVMELLQLALDAPAVQRAEKLDQACGNDSALRRELDELLTLEGQADAFLAQPAHDLLPSPSARANSLEETRLGPYRLHELLGRGGMGSVYRARREDDYDKQVAIKVVQRHLLGATTIARFHNERQILARLEHPSIARLFDGGTTEDGRPYLVMELVVGEPIDTYCEHHQLSVAQRLELFAQVCSALALAHRNLVVHRDLKPSNVLVGADGVPKLLDFGIAKLLGDDLSGGLTRTSSAPMTPRFASPEQVRQQPVTTTSDIYALGLLLYLLLTGHLPNELHDCGIEEIAERVVRHQPLRPSTLVRRRHTRGSTTATAFDPYRWSRLLKGDLDAIVLQALRKEPQQRYSSVDQLADDLRRHRAGLPVRARRGTTIYRSTKFLRRHRKTLGVLVVALGVAGFWLWSSGRQRLAQRQRAERVVAVMRELINVADPDRRGGAELTPSLILDRAARQLDEPELDAEPELRAELGATLGKLYYQLGQIDPALSLLSQSLSTWRGLHPGASSGLAARLNNLGAIHLEALDYAEAESLMDEALAIYQQLGDLEKAAAIQSNLATTLLYRGAYDAAEALYQSSLETRRQLYGNDDPRIASGLRSLAAALYARGQPTNAVDLLEEALRIRRAEFGPDHTLVASVLDLLGSVRRALGDVWTAEQHYRQALEIFRHRFGDEHFQVAHSERNLSELLLAEGELDTARLLLRRARRKLRQNRPTSDWRWADADSLLGELYRREGRLAEAERCLAPAYQALLDLNGEHALSTRDARQRLLDLHPADNIGGQDG